MDAPVCNRWHGSSAMSEQPGVGSDLSLTDALVGCLPGAVLGGIIQAVCGWHVGADGIAYPPWGGMLIGLLVGFFFGGFYGHYAIRSRLGLGILGGVIGASVGLVLDRGSGRAY